MYSPRICLAADDVAGNGAVGGSTGGEAEHAKDGCGQHTECVTSSETKTLM